MIVIGIALRIQAGGALNCVNQPEVGAKTRSLAPGGRWAGFPSFITDKGLSDPGTVPRATKLLLLRRDDPADSDS